MNFTKEAPSKYLFKKITRIEKIGQLFSPAVFIHDTEENYDQIESLIKNYHIGGLTFFHSRISAAANYGSKLKADHYKNSLDRIKELIQHFQSISKFPLLISIDAEWGLAMRIEDTPQYPYAITLGALPDDQNELIYYVGYNIGKDCLDAGIHLNLAPVVDINEDPDNPVIGYRSFGEDKYNVTKKSLAYCNGVTAAGAAACMKHFPGHGNTSVDSHLGLPVIDKTKKELFNNEFLPFIEGIKAGVDTIMVGHLAVPALTEGKVIPASLSSIIIKDILRDKLNFQGLVISDALNMKSVSDLFDQKGKLELEAFKAGNDLLCFSENVPEAIDLIDKEIQDHQLNESFERIRTLKNKIFGNENNKEKIPEFELNKKIATGAITKLNNAIINKYSSGIGNSRAALVSINKTINNEFSRKINKYRIIPQYEIIQATGARLEITKNSLLQYEKLILAIYVPAVKPANNYGIDPSIKKFVEDIVSSVTCIVCYFGNPYSINYLNGLSKAENLFIAYQDMPEFEERAAELIFGEFEASGKIPVSLNL